MDCPESLPLAVEKGALPRAKRKPGTTGGEGEWVAFKAIPLRFPNKQCPNHNIQHVRKNTLVTNMFQTQQ